MFKTIKFLFLKTGTMYYLQVREVVWQLASLTQGSYTIIVSTYHPSSAKYELVVHSCARFELTKLISSDDEYIP